MEGGSHSISLVLVVDGKALDQTLRSSGKRPAFSLVHRVDPSNRSRNIEAHRSAAADPLAFCRIEDALIAKRSVFGHNYHRYEPKGYELQGIASKIEGGLQWS